jgi:hypothetical protein
VGERDRFGSAHLTLLSLQLTGLSMLAALAPWQRRFVVILLLGCAVDLSLGVLLHARVESVENTATATPFPELTFADGAIQIAPPGPEALSRAARGNWYAKHQLAFLLRIDREFQDRYGRDPAFRKVSPEITAEIARVRAEDAGNWQGWFERHAGELEYLGDHVAGRSGLGTNVVTALLLIFLAGLGAILWRTRGTI